MILKRPWSAFAVKIPIPGDSHVQELIGTTVHQMALRVQIPDRSKVLRRSLLVVAVSDFEVLVGAIAALILADQPDRLDRTETAFTLKQLKEFGTIEAASSFAIEKKVESLLRDGIEEWEKWFSARGTEVKMRDMTQDWSQFCEVFARRNVLVHAGGMVNKQYLLKIKNAGSTQPEAQEGQVVDVSSDYLESSLNRLAAVGFLLATGTALQLRRQQGHRDRVLGWLVNRTGYLAENRMQEAVLSICSTVLHSGRGRIKRDIEMRINKLRWTALRDLGKSDQMKSEIENWDFGGLDPYYHHVRHVLLEKNSDILTSTSALLESGRLTPIMLRNDPLYNPLWVSHAFDNLRMNEDIREVGGHDLPDDGAE